MTYLFLSFWNVDTDYCNRFCQQPVQSIYIIGSFILNIISILPSMPWFPEQFPLPKVYVRVFLLSHACNVICTAHHKLLELNRFRITRQSAGSTTDNEAHHWT